ncbi:cytochrome oxidase complex assembly protein 1-domain-containing protein [Schizophyllum commune]|nr:DUF1783-domain-containing protein [Schizophyllum commune Loenen D]
MSSAVTARLARRLPSSFARPICRRNFATELPRPPPREQPEPELYQHTSRPRPYVKIPAAPRRPLPSIPRRWPAVLAFAAVGVVGWAVFFTYVTNQEKVTSSVVQQMLRSMKSSEELHEYMGDAIRPVPEWWLNGDPWIHGRVNQINGSIDLSFKIKGSKGSGTVYFTSVRKEKGEPFVILRFRVIGDDGTIINLTA